MFAINNEEELLQITGGLNVSGAIINAFRSAANVVMDIGRSLGSAIRRIAYGNLCAI